MKTPRIATLLATALLAAAPAFAQRAAPVAMITDLAGAVKVSVPAGAVPAGLAAEIPADARIDVPAGGKLVVLVLATGDEFTLSGPVTAQAKADGLSGTPAERLVRKASSVGKVKLKSDRLVQAAVTLRASRRPEALPLLSASGTTVLDAKPVFRWKAIEGATAYRLELQDGAGKLLHEARVEATELRLPDGVKLEDGKTYSWEVSTRQANGAAYASFGDFTVATGALREQAAKLKPAAGAPVSERVAYAAWLGSQELNDEARAAWQQLSRERPDDPQLKALAGR